MGKEVLVLGAGLVARPLVRYLLNNGIGVTIATRTVAKAQALLEDHPNGVAIRLDLDNGDGLDALISASRVVVSLLPYTYHPRVARRCLALGKSMVTTSYVSNEMRELSQPAQRSGLLFLNEIGLDPGIDHMSAMRVIHDVERRGGRVVSFKSYCGGLPAPDANDNPWGYKFSWSPRGVLMAGRNNARFLEGGKVREIESADLFANMSLLHVDGVGILEAYPNRDSLQYISTYGLGGVSTMFRGTLRYPGWCRMMKGLVDLGWLDLSAPPKGVKTVRDLTAKLAAADAGEGLEGIVARRLGLDPKGETMRRYEWAGLFSSVPLPAEETILDVLAWLLKAKLAYRAGERDMVVLLHEFEAEWADGKREKIRSTLIDYGVPGGDSAMARTVSLPAAIATKLILEGKIRSTGVKIPVAPEIYNPVLDTLEEMNIVCTKTIE